MNTGRGERVRSRAGRGPQWGHSLGEDTQPRVLASSPSTWAPTSPLQALPIPQRQGKLWAQLQNYSLWAPHPQPLLPRVVRQRRKQY